jgi:hypothetical protein
VPLLAQLMESKRWCYWLDRTHPGQQAGTYRVSVVVEDTSGHFPTGGGEMQAPWYWNKETCRQVNQERCGVDEETSLEIVASSMFAT